MLQHALLLILVAFLVTFGLRLTPFLVRSWLKDNAVLRDLGRLMPIGIMIILVVYSFTGIMDDGIIPAVIGVLVTAGLHLWKGQMMISIVGGVLAYGICLAII